MNTLSPRLLVDTSSTNTPDFQLPPPQTQMENTANTHQTVTTEVPPPATTDATALDNSAALKTAFGDSCNWKALSEKLQALVQTLTRNFPLDDPATRATNKASLESDLASRLKTTSLYVCEDSTYYREHTLTPAHVVSLEAFIDGNALSVPKTLDGLMALTSAALRQSQVHPLGNFSGALGWSVPLEKEHQDAIITLLDSGPSGVPGLPLADGSKGLLRHLLSGSSVTDTDLQNPTIALEKLLASPKAQALGVAIQQKLGLYPNDTSIHDGVLTALQLSLDPESYRTPARNKIAGFDLAQRQHWGKPASVIIDELASQLIRQGKATPQTANLAARLLLTHSAPQFLVKGIPPTVTYGSLTWAQLAIATAKVEADSPGRSLNMTYAEILAGAAQMSNEGLTTHSAQYEALRDWALVNGFLTTAETVPTDHQMENIRTTFNNQLSALTTTSTALQTELPSRREMALAMLKAQFPLLDESVFEAKVIWKAVLPPGRPGKFPGVHSMLDIVMEGDKINAPQEHWLTTDKRIPINTFCTLSAAGTLTLGTAFSTDYNNAITSLEKGHQGFAEYLIGNLPLEDRLNFEYGTLEFFHTNTYKLAMDFTSPPTLRSRGHTLTVKIKRGDDVNLYVINTKNGTVRKDNTQREKYSEPYSSAKLEVRDVSIISKTVLFNPFEDEHARYAPGKEVSAEVPQTSTSNRTKYIAKVFAKSLDLHNDDLLNHARGVTSYDKSRAGDAAIGDFMLNLIPLRSAIVNFMKGNYGEGVMDLGLDLIGLLTLGAGKAAQAGKVFAKGVSSAKGVARAARFVGATAIEAFNPLDGLSALTGGVTRLLGRGATFGWKGVKTVAGQARSYDLLKAVSKQEGVAATGTYKVAGQRIESDTVFDNGSWHFYDASKKKAYGIAPREYRPNIVAANGIVKVFDDTPDLLDYRVNSVPEHLLTPRGLQANVYVGPNNKEYVKIDGGLYESILNNGQRHIRHPSGNSPDLPIKDLGVAGWEPISRGNRALGGAPPASGWKLPNDTFVLPIDDVKITNVPSHPYALHYKGEDHYVRFDAEAGAWKSYMTGTSSRVGGMNISYLYFWRTGKGQWKLGTFAELKKAKPIKSNKYVFAQPAVPVSLHAPLDAKPIPKEIHYFWAGGDMKEKLRKNIMDNALNAPGYKSIVHVDADSLEGFTTLKKQLEEHTPGVEVKNLNDDDILKQPNVTDMYAYFRQGQGKNLAAASDVARYPIMKKYGGIYLDTDDTLAKNVSGIELNAGPNDVLLNSPRSHEVTNDVPFYNTSNFATQAGNPVIDKMIQEMNTRFARSKPYFETNRPIASRDATGRLELPPAFRAYEQTIFETVGPTMFNDVLKSSRPDMYNLGFDGARPISRVNGRPQFTGPARDLTRDLRQQYADSGITLPSNAEETLRDMKTHYLPFKDRFKVDIGAEHSWADT
ncbi:glycosyltransferase family 32 protein [Pseudomonas fluorescens]